MNYSSTIETGGIMIVPYPAPENQVWKPSCPMRPFFGVDPVLLDDKVCFIFALLFSLVPRCLFWCCLLFFKFITE